MNKLHVNICILCTFLLIACSNPTGSNNSDAYISGTITKINTGSERLTILVEEDSTVDVPEKKNGKKVFFFISNETEIYKQSDAKSLNKIEPEYLKVGMDVKGWAADGPVLMSYPPYVGATKIVVIGQL